MNYRRVIQAAVCLMIAALLFAHPLPAGAKTNHCGKPCKSAHCQNCDCHNKESRSRDGCDHQLGNESSSDSVWRTCLCSVSMPVANGATKTQIPDDITSRLQPTRIDFMPIPPVAATRTFQSRVDSTFGKHSDFRRRLLCTWVI